MKTIWLVRHGETQFNREGKLQGASDSELTELGLKQIENLRSFFKDKSLEAIFSSDLKRAQRSAESVAQDFNLPTQTSALFRERCYGIYEKSDYSLYRKEVGEKHSLIDFAPAKGESLAQVCARAERGLQELLSHSARNILLVGHGGFNRCFLKVACALPQESVYSLKQGNCCINKIKQAASGTFTLELSNYLGHLE